MYKVLIADDEPMIRAGLYYRYDWAAMGFEVAAMLEEVFGAASEGTE